MMTSNAAFKKQVRELAAQSGIPYAEARSRLLGATGLSRTNAATDLSIDEIARIIGRILITRAIELETADRKEAAAELAWAEPYERQGLRVVVAEPTHTDGSERWNVKDWRTGKTLATGLSVYNDLNKQNGWIDISEGVREGPLAADFGHHETTAFAALPNDAAPQLDSFISELMLTMDYEDWPREFASWVGTKTSPGQPV